MLGDQREAGVYLMPKGEAEGGTEPVPKGAVEEERSPNLRGTRAKGEQNSSTGAKAAVARLMELGVSEENALDALLAAGLKSLITQYFPF